MRIRWTGLDRRATIPLTVVGLLVFAVLYKATCQYVRLEGLPRYEVIIYARNLTLAPGT